MKPFCGINLTSNKKNEQLNGDEFLVAKTSQALSESFNRTSDMVDETIENSKLPLAIRIIHWICGVVGAFVVIGILRSLVGEDRVTLRQAYENAWWLFWAGGVCLAIWAILKILSHNKEKAVLETDEGEQVLSDLDQTCNAIMTELNVPNDSKEVDILSFFYKVKNGQIKVCEKGMQLSPYNNLIFNVYADEQNLYLANLDGKYAFPLSNLKAIKTIKKSICFSCWNKDEDYDEGIYKQYKITENDIGNIFCKPYHILEIELNGEIWGIYFPCYELPIFENLTGLKAEQD